METESAAKYKVKVFAGVRVKMRDGVELNVKIMRPDGPGKFPGVMEYTPYRMQSGPRPADYRDEIPMVAWYLAERGYAVVQFEVRGTGSSTGYSETVYSEEERQDGHDMVEWIAKQEWCTGAVGMIGISHGAVVQWQVAVQQPPHLKTIIVRSANDDVYTEFTNPGGCIRPWIFEAYATHMNASNFAPPSAELAGEQWAEMWQERLEKSVPWSVSHLQNIVDGPFWKCKSLNAGYERVKVPVLLIEGWADWYATAELRAFQKLQVPKKVLIGPWGHYYPDVAFPGPRIDGCRFYLRWFDHWLKGMANGVMEEPAVTVFVRGWKEPGLMYVEDKGTWRNESAWPPERAKMTALYLGEGGRLEEKAAGKAGGAGVDSFEHRASAGITTGRRSGLGSTTPWGLPLDQRADEMFGAVYTGEPLAQAMEVMGEAEVELQVSSTAKTAYFHVKLCDVSPEGVSRLITDGGVLGTHRHSHEKPEAMEPEKIYTLKFSLKHIAYRVEAGHRLRVSVASADFQNAWPTGERGRHSVHRGSSRVTVPLVIAGTETLPEPKLGKSSRSLPAEGAVPKPVYTLHHDLANDTVACELVPAEGAVRGEQWTRRSLYTVSNRNPWRASIMAATTLQPVHPTLDILVTADCETVSDEKTYTHVSQVEITVNGRPFFQKSWTVTVGRQFS